MSPITRRDFIKTGAKGLALVSIPLFFRSNPLAAFTVPPAGEINLNDCFEHFGVSETTIRKAMETALSRGGDYCDIFFQHSLSSFIGLEDDLVNRAYTNVDFGVGIRVLKGDQTGYSFTEDISPEAMKKAAATAANIADSTGGTSPIPFALRETPQYYPIQTLWEDISIDKKIPYLEKINERMLSGDKRIIKTQVGFSDEGSYIMVVTSEGRVACDYQPMTYVYAGCSAEQNGQRERNSWDISGRYGIEILTPKATNRIADEAVRRTVALFDAVKPEGGEKEIVLAAGSSGILLHEAIGHGMEADFNRMNKSIFADKINKPVAENFVSIVDDGTIPGSRGSINIDDEGNDTEKTFLVENGILRSYLHDRISAKYYKVKPTGSGRRQSFRYQPIPRMRSTYMLNGPHKKEEIIASVKNGVYTEEFTNGQVLIGPGDFTFYVKSGYLIENGKLTRPVKDINIIGNGPDVLSKVVMVADDLALAEGGWTCGKDGQSVPVSMGLPTVKVSSITVGGV